MSYVKQTLMPDETLVVDGKLHWLPLAMQAGLIVGVSFALLVCAVLVLESGNDLVRVIAGFAAIFLVLMLVGAIVGMAAALLAFFFGEEVAVTDRRVILKSGVFRRKTMAIPFRQAESVAFDQTFLERLLRTGQVRVRGSGAGWMQTPLLANVDEFRQAVTERVEALHGPGHGPSGGGVVTRGFSEE